MVGPPALRHRSIASLRRRPMMMVIFSSLRFLYADIFFMSSLNEDNHLFEGRRAPTFHILQFLIRRHGDDIFTRRRLIRHCNIFAWQ